MVATRTTEKPNASCRNSCQVKPSWIATGTAQHTSRTDAAAIAHATADAAALDDRTDQLSHDANPPASVQARTAKSAPAPMRMGRPWSHHGPKPRTHNKESHQCP